MTRKLASKRPLAVHQPARAARSAGRFWMSLVSCACRKSRASAPVTTSNPYRFNRAHSIVDPFYGKPTLERRFLEPPRHGVHTKSRGRAGLRLQECRRKRAVTATELGRTQRLLGA